MSGRPDSFLPLYVGDYLADTSHLSACEHGAYLLLIMHYWRTGKPLPHDASVLCRIARMSRTEWDTVSVTVTAFFTVTVMDTVTDTVTVLTHKRVEEELERARGKYEIRKAASKRANAAKKAAILRIGDRDGDRIGNPNGDRDGTQPQPQPQPQSSYEEKEDSRSNARAESLLSRICEILRIRLLDDPSRLAWPRQVEEMLRDGLDETEIIRATEVARTNGKLSLAYIRAVALKPQKEPENDGRNGPDPNRPHQRDIARDNAAEHALAAIRGRSNEDATGGSGQSAGRREPETVVIEARPSGNPGADHRPRPDDGNHLPASVAERAREVGKIPDFLRRPQPKANPGTGLSMEAIPNERREILPDTGADFGPVQVRG